MKDSTPKCSYASSFGCDHLPDELISTYKNLLSRFQKIAVREKSGAKLVHSLIGKKPPVVVDPVLLLDKRQWEDILPPPKEKKPFVFVYQMAHSAYPAQFAHYIANRQHMSVHFIPFPIGGFCPCHIHLSKSPLEWLRMIHDAQFVLTDSFHSTVFSILFHRPFYYVITSSTVKKRLNRIKTLLESLGLEDRIIYEKKDFVIDREIDWALVDKRLNEIREQSLAVMKEILQCKAEA